MKRLLPILIIFCACQKEDVTIPERNNELHSISFDLSGFARETEAMGKEVLAGKTKSVSAATADGLPTLHYFAYDKATGELVSDQISYWDWSSPGENEDYGKFTDSLPGGKYDIVFLGHWRVDEAPWPHTKVFDKDNFNTAYLDVEFEYQAYLEPELFFQHEQIEVTGDTVMNDIMLPRVVGELVVRLTDDNFPDDLDVVSVTYDSHSGFPFNRKPGNIKSRVFDLSAQDGPGLSGSGYSIPDPASGKLTTDVIIRAFRSGETFPPDTLVQKVIHDVEIEANKRTILTGKLFDGTSHSQAFAVHVDTAWGGDKELEF